MGPEFRRFRSSFCPSQQEFGNIPLPLCVQNARKSDPEESAAPARRLVRKGGRCPPSCSGTAGRWQHTHSSTRQGRERHCSFHLLVTNSDTTSLQASQFLGHVVCREVCCRASSAARNNTIKHDFGSYSMLGTNMWACFDVYRRLLGGNLAGRCRTLVRARRRALGAFLSVFCLYCSETDTEQSQAAPCIHKSRPMRKDDTHNPSRAHWLCNTLQDKSVGLHKIRAPPDLGLVRQLLWQEQPIVVASDQIMGLSSTRFGCFRPNSALTSAELELCSDRLDREEVGLIAAKVRLRVRRPKHAPAKVSRCPEKNRRRK